MAKADTWMPLYLAKYERATSRLSLAEDGAYMRLIRDYWVNGAPPNDDAVIARILRVERKEWLKIRPALAGFFDIRDGHWFHDTVERERQKALELTETRRTTGALGGRPRKQTESNAKPNGFSELNQTGSQTETPARVASPSPSPNGESEDADASSVGSAEPMPTGKGKAKSEPWAKDADFLAAWDAATDQMRARSSRKQAYQPWKAHGAPGDKKRAALAAYLDRDPDVKRTGGPGLHLWLRDKLPEWLEKAPPSKTTKVVWSGPPEILAIVERAFPGKGSGYLTAYCAWQAAPAKALLCRNNLICDFIRREAGGALGAIGVKVLLAEKST